ncbi:patatin-like phospholipase family protein [Alphaproteobacteria bacterium]|nr:patatin-like phospholipase family protein [Alphaproteobacteria bacterium]
MKSKVFRVLSLDGGGIRGMYTSAFLYKMQSNVLKPPTPLEGKDPNDELDVGRAFDLIVGTSSGSIIGCGLAAGVPVSRIAEAFKVFGEKAFPYPVPSKSQDGLNFYFKLLCDIRNRKKNLLDGEQALASELEKVFQDETVGGLWERRKIALAVPSIHMANHQAWVFKTPHLDGTNNRDDGYKLWEVCLASTAAPVFRALANIEDPNSEGRKTHKTFVDGGLVANNPVLCALWDSLEMTNEGDAIEVYCLGTIPPQGGDIVDFNDNAWSYLEWQGGGKVVEVSLNAQQTLHHHMALTFAKHFKRDCRIYRFPTSPSSPDVSSFTGLDRVSSSAVNALTALAEADADEVNRMMNDASCLQGQAFSNLFSSIKTFNQWEREGPGNV